MPKRKLIPYAKNLKEKSRQLRNNSTLAEILLWNQLKGRKFKGYQFLRQKPLDNYIVDFFCYRLMLAIEIDGISHNEKEDYDEKRQSHLETYGIHFLRFQERDVLKNMDGVLTRLEAWIDEYEKKSMNSFKSNVLTSP